MWRQLLFQTCRGFPQQVTVAGGEYAGIGSRGFDPQNLGNGNKENLLLILHHKTFQRAETTEGLKQWFKVAIGVTMRKHGYVEGTGTGNVYADLRIVNPQEARAKADLAHRIVDIIEARKLTQVQAGKLLGVDQPKVSALKRGRLTDFSIERLVGFLLLLDHNVQITVTPKPHSSRKPPTLEVNAMGAVAAARR